ncbi:MAG: hypothetical protein WCJ19_03055 [bacterium]
MNKSLIDLQKKLLDKLQGGNKRFVHLNASIGKSRDKLDLISLNSLIPNSSKEFLSKLLSESNFTFKVSFKDIDSKILSFTNKQKKKGEDLFNDKIEKGTELELTVLKILRDIRKKLDYLSALQKEEENEFGTKSFAFGYPLLLKQMSSETDDVICAPLFLWYLDIEEQDKEFGYKSIKSK